MRITIICVGKLRENHWQLAVKEYSKRLTRYSKLEIIELSDEKAPETLSKAEEELVLKKEGERILKAIKSDAFVIALAIKGTPLSSENLASLIEHNANSGLSHITFIIGGSLGLSNDVMTRVNDSISFSMMTFPHAMMRVILLEQIYRSMKIIKKEPYHK